MIFVDEEFLVPVVPNIMVLSGKDNNNSAIYYYVDKSVYDQAVKLSLKKLEIINKLIPSTYNEDVAEWFSKIAPNPVNYLAYFLKLIIEDLDKDITLCCKALTSISRLINMEGYIGLNAEVRKSVTFSLTITDDADSTWKLFKSLTVAKAKFESMLYNANDLQVMNANTVQYSQELQESKDTISDTPEMSDDEIFAWAEAEAAKQIKAEEEDKEKNKEKSKSKEEETELKEDGTGLKEELTEVKEKDEISKIFFANLRR